MISSPELNFGKDENENPGRTEVPSKLGQDPLRFSLAVQALSPDAKAQERNFP